MPAVEGALLGQHMPLGLGRVPVPPRGKLPLSGRRALRGQLVAVHEHLPTGRAHKMLGRQLRLRRYALPVVGLAFAIAHISTLEELGRRAVVPPALCEGETKGKEGREEGCVQTAQVHWKCILVLFPACTHDLPLSLRSPAALPYRCPSGACVRNRAACVDVAFVAMNLADLPTAATLARANGILTIGNGPSDSDEGALAVTNDLAACPPDKPIQCWDGQCASDPIDVCPPNTAPTAHCTNLSPGNSKGDGVLRGGLAGRRFFTKEK